MSTAIITPKKAVLLSAVHTLLYVGVLYVSKASRPSATKNKDFPSVIKSRAAGVCIALLLSVFGNRCIIEQARQAGQRTGIREWDDILRGWGEWKLDVNQTFHAWGLTALLFLGPLVERLWIEEGYRDLGNGVVNAMTSLIGWRNYIIGPASEEIVFRGCIIPLFLMARVRPLTIIFITPLFFGLAHIHHAYEHNLHHPRSPLTTVLVTFIQFTYTTLFGWYASYLFITTQTIWAPVVVHTFCNVMGLPRFWGGIPGVAGWISGVYYLCLIVGAIGFVKYIGSIKPEGLVL